ncbi:hypothetical protein [Acinetobacter populi]|uniref:hypothetical protein n=1 Tax=Acinetobacter populi TaxID=1582270 RepID=UPI001FE33307|nr:hypothetical protein [Acinetobacter populi]
METSQASLGRFIADIVENSLLHIWENLGISQPVAYRLIKHLNGFGQLMNSAYNTVLSLGLYK